MEQAINKLFIILCCSFLAQSLYAQEVIVPLGFNGAVIQKQGQKPTAQQKTTALTLPFFEDFTDYSTWPNNAKWQDGKVYINNTMGVSPISRGVATFDGLDAGGLPYNKFISTAYLYADSLTSQPIDLSASNPGDSVYLSFFYQPQGNGFAPETQDSLILYLKKSNDAWIKVWAKEGRLLDSFKQVMVAITDTSYFNASFQFRFVNKASLNTNDDVWNVDYIKIAANRSMGDTVINDIAMAANPGFLLNDYTYMPYRQFIADPTKERATQLTATIRNGYNAPQNVNYGYTSKEKFTGAFFTTNNTGSTTIVSNDKVGVTMPAYTNTMALVNNNDNYTFDTKYFVQSLSPADNPVNDTILQEQVFYNCLAYDDGTAEKAYYLNMFATLPGKTAIEYHLNKPDTITGVSIYFGRQVPLAFAKYFSVAIYTDISMTGGADKLKYQEDFLIPAYLRNDFTWTYKFDHPVPMPAGTFYIGTIQPALSNSDSLYLGLDVNRVSANHLYYNVVGYWQPSTIGGAVMIRPMLGVIFPSDVAAVNKKQDLKWFTSPSPVHDRLKVQYDYEGTANYQLIDISGKMMLSGTIKDGDYIDVNDLAPGVYIMRLNTDGMQGLPQKLIKY